MLETSQDASEPVENPTRQHGRGGWYVDIPGALLLVMLGVFVMFGLYHPVIVEGTSMLPQLEDADRLFINQVAYSRLGSMVGQSIQRGDVVVFRYPRDERKSYIKRVIALPGDELQIDHGRVMVNGTELNEPYVPGRFADERSLAPMTVPTGEYFVMGDHRSISSDSRDFGPVARPLIYGRAAFVYWPVDQAGVVH